jgi:hypothetical protein
MGSRVSYAIKQYFDGQPERGAQNQAKLEFPIKNRDPWRKSRDGRGTGKGSERSPTKHQKQATFEGCVG